ncbi:MAG TPA: serine/threonine-protein kinase [Vicinamibacterales bacterium]|nr:serine/threonine-protein kinase [Vicinamibacterales bacterium]
MAEDGYAELAADAYLRVALVDPEYEDVAFRLVSVGRPDAFADETTRSRLRDEMPRRLGRYRLLEPIGHGTTGRVYLAKDSRINRLVAIKLIDLSAERDDTEIEDAKDRFRREAETAGRLQHPNIVTIFDIGDSKGRTYIAMEYLKGDLLSRFTSPDTLLPPRLVLELGALAADALDYAHTQNVIHRDIKPGNIMYDSVSGDLKITDFGIARLIDVNRTRTGVVLGTPSFMSPEQIEGGNVKGHTDLFALGVSLYELLTGRLPFRGTSMTNLMFVIANEPHERLSAARPGLPAELDALIDNALHKQPESRFQSGADMAEALRQVVRLLPETNACRA